MVMRSGLAVAVAVVVAALAGTTEMASAATHRRDSVVCFILYEIGPRWGFGSFSAEEDVKRFRGRTARRNVRLRRRVG